MRPAVASGENFKKTQDALETSLKSSHYDQSTEIVDPSSFTPQSRFDNITTTDPQITNIQTSSDNTIKFTIGSGLSGRTICAKLTTPITSDNLKSAIFSAIAKNETSKNKKFVSYYTESSPSSSGNNDSFWMCLFAIDLSDL